MAKEYSDRQMKPKAPQREYFFPKEKPPVTITAASREEAEKKLAKLSDKKNAE